MNHDIRLRAPAFLGGGDAPVVVRRTDQRFIEGLLADLRTPEGRKKLVDQVARQGAEADPVLYLPTQRAFHVVLAEAYCDVPGDPRVAREKIKAAGAVIRRRVPLRRGAEAKGFALLKKKAGPSKGSHGVYGSPQRWVTQADKVLGWRPMASADVGQDPHSGKRRVPSAGHPEIDRRLAVLRLEGRTEDQAPHDEAVTTLFVAPPDVCKATGSTILYGVVQPVENEIVEKATLAAGGGDEDASPPEYTESEVRALLPIWLRFRESGVPAPIPGDLKGRTFRAVDANGSKDLFELQLQRKNGDAWEKFDAPPLWKAEPGGTGTDLRAFLRFLWQVRVEFDLWGPSQASKALKQTLDGLSVTVGGKGLKLCDWLRDATDVFVLMEEGRQVAFPDTWPLVPQATHTSVISAAKAALEQRLQTFTRHETRYGRDDARYEIKAFARVLHDPECPPSLVWSAETHRYRVARWYEGGPDDAPLPTIEMPTIGRGFLKQLQPNVAIRVPRSMFNFTNNLDIQKVLDGDQKNDTSGPDFAWICGFNISIIFMIAFMLLISFVFMLNIVFWWVIFFRICIPLPGVASQESQ